MDFLISKNDYFIIEHCYSCAVPGYLIVSPVVDVTSIADLPQAFLTQLGVNLAKATALVDEIIRPIKIYCAQFGEEGTELHFHIFPRTPALTSEFLRAFPGQQDLIHGPLLLDWARTKYKATQHTNWSAASSVITEMRKWLSRSAPV